MGALFMTRNARKKQELAVAAIGEMWLGFVSGSATNHNAQKRTATPTPGERDLNMDLEFELKVSGTEELASKTSVLTAVAGLIRERPSPLEEVFRRVGLA